MKLIKKLFLILAMALSCFGIGIAGEADDIILPTTECDVDDIHRTMLILDDNFSISKCIAIGGKCKILTI